MYGGRNFDPLKEISKGRKNVQKKVRRYGLSTCFVLGNLWLRTH